MEKNNEIECCGRLSTGYPKTPMTWKSVTLYGKRDFADTIFFFKDLEPER